MLLTKMLSLKKDSTEDITVFTPPCYTCAHRSSPGATNCTAYPNGIPVAILSGMIGHDFPVTGDNGITYQEADTVQKANPYKDDAGRYTSKEKATKVISFNDDMSAQLKWLSDKAKENGKATIDDLLAEAPDYMLQLGKRWRQYHTFKGFRASILKDNPYHDGKGMFTSKDKAATGGEWVEVPNSQLGSNEGGVYHHNGVKKYVKFAKNPDQAEAEATSARIHEMMGVHTVHPEVVMVKGRKAIASEWVDGVKPLGRSGWDNLSSGQRDQAVDAFMAGILTKNWDVVGMTYDNLCKGKNGNLVLVDTGGSFEYRAQGGHKTFDGDISGEVSSFLSPEKTSGRVYAPMFKSHPETFHKAARRLGNIPDKQLRAAVMASGMKDKGRIADAIVKRKQAILAQF